MLRISKIGTVKIVMHEPPLYKQTREEREKEEGEETNQETRER